MSSNTEKTEKLSEKKYWDSVHAGRKGAGAPAHVRAAKKILGPSTIDRMRSYEDHLLKVEQVFTRLRKAGLKIIINGLYSCWTLRVSIQTIFKTFF